MIKLANQLASLYNDINTRGVEAISNHQEQVDYFLTHPKEDNRRGLTLLAHLPAHISRNINICLQGLGANKGSVYRYPAHDMHITVLDLLGAKADFRITPAAIDAYRQALQSLLIKFPPIEWRLTGFIASPAALIVKGNYSAALSNLRMAIRKQLPAQNLTIDERYPTYSGHVTVGRFVKPLADYRSFLSYLADNNQTELGRFKSRELDLVVHDWYNHRVEKIATLPLRGI